MRMYKGIESGTIFDGAVGDTYNNYRVVRLMQDIFGFTMDAAETKAVERVYDATVYHGHADPSDYELVGLIAEDFISKANDEAIKDNFTFSWHEGDFFLFDDLNYGWDN